MRQTSYEDTRDGGGGFGRGIDTRRQGWNENIAKRLHFYLCMHDNIINPLISNTVPVKGKLTVTRNSNDSTRNSKLENLRGEIFESSVLSFESRTLSFAFRVSSKELRVSSRVSRREINELTGPLTVLFPQDKAGKKIALGCISLNLNFTVAPE